jgi:hypothetical protein
MFLCDESLIENRKFSHACQSFRLLCMNDTICQDNQFLLAAVCCAPVAFK